MDDPDCDAAQLTRTLNAFARSNRLFTRYRSILRRWIIPDMQRAPARRHRVVDLGAGGCDIAVWLLEQCRRTGLREDVVALDANPRVVAYARQKYGHVASLDIRHEDALGFNGFADDYVFGNHFLHHLGNNEIVALLRKLAALPVRRFVFSDLCRHYRAYYVISLAGAALFPGTFIGYDGRLSVRKGFSIAEMESFLTRAGLHPQTQIHTLAPARVVLVGEGQRGRTTELSSST